MVGKIQEWLEGLGLAKYATAFAENEIDFGALRHLGEDDLRELGLPMGPRKKLLAAIAELGVPESASLPVDAPAREAERRQLTVMFIDLVGSTALSGRLDPEDLREVMRRYQDAAAGAITRYGGHVAKFLGDGVLAYFGWPRAHEDQAERAVRAGLDAVAAVQGVTADGGALHARVGIATGEVVIGDMVGETTSETDAIVGETPNLAARLQGVAKPDQVVIGAATRRLVGESFALDDLGERKLKGIKGKVLAWRVSGELAAESRFEAAHAGRLTAFVGRDEEVDLLLKRWQQAKAREGQAALLSGEAGIGKSRITQTLRERLAGEAYTRLRYQCSPFHTSTAFRPFISQLERAAGLAPDDTPEAKLDKIEALLAQSTESVSDVAPLVAALLSVPTGDRYPPLDLTPPVQKEKTLEALTDQLLGLAAQRPVLIIFEDVHWVDPTSLDALERMIDRIQGAPVLAVITCRPEFTPPWSGHTHTTALTLNRLGREPCAAMVESVTGGKALPAKVLDQIVAKTDGVPLFVEELTKTVLESGLLEDKGDRYELSGPLPPLAIPSTLQDSLMARLDRLAPVKELAQIGATIGRTFSHRLLEAVSPLGGNELENALGQLVESELVFRRGIPPDASYIFKHALVQDTAYGSLLKSRRQQLHQRIAESIERDFPEVVETQPEILAHHFTEAGLAERGIGYWLAAGQNSVRRGANVEAIDHLTRGLDLLETIPQSPERLSRELDLQTALGPTLSATKGWASPEAKAVFTRTHELCRQAENSPHLFASLWGIWLYHTGAGNAPAARALSQELLSLAEQENDPELLLQAHHANWGGTMTLGELDKALEHVELGLAIYDPVKHREHAMRYGGHDPGVCARGQGGCALWLAGFPDRARDSVERGIAQAHDLGHPPSVAHALLWACLVYQFRREAEEVRERASIQRDLATEHGLALYLAAGTESHGWAIASQGRPEEGIRQLREALTLYRATGAGMFKAYLLAQLAESCGWAGLVAEGLRAVDEASEAVAKSGERFWEPEIHRLQGELMLARSADAAAEAEALFQQAAGVARDIGARSLELRAATSLSRLWQGQGKAAEAREMLQPIYNWFTEGFETSDLMDAKALLDEIS